MDADRNDRIAPQLLADSPRGGSPTAVEWEVALAGDDVEGVDNPKVVEWEDLQQELARLWSLSSALRRAKERKEALAGRIQSVIDAKRGSLLQSNQLEEMKEKLDAKKLAVANLSADTKRILQDVRNQKEELFFALRLLMVAGKTLISAHQQLQEANKLLSGERGYGHLRDLERLRRMRQQYMISQVSALYPIKAMNEQELKETLDSHSTENKSGETSGSSSAEVVKPLKSLTILSLQLTALPLKKTSFFSDKKAIQRSACALGYVAHAVLLIASYLDVPLRYPVHIGGSRSYVQDYAPSVEVTASDLTNPLFTSVTAGTTEFPLFFEGQDTTRAAYAIFLLNKDLEQLLNSIGAESLGPRHVLANLKELVRIILSEAYIAK